MICDLTNYYCQTLKAIRQERGTISSMELQQVLQQQQAQESNLPCFMLALEVFGVVGNLPQAGIKLGKTQTGGLRGESLLDRKSVV